MPEARTGLTDRDFGAFFELFNDGGFGDAEIFNMWTWLLLILSERMLIKNNKQPRQAACAGKGQNQQWEEWLPNNGNNRWKGGPLNFWGKPPNAELYDEVPAWCDGSLEEYKWYDPKKNGIYSDLPTANKENKDAGGALKGDFNRMDATDTKNNGIYFKLTHNIHERQLMGGVPVPVKVYANMTKPSDSRLLKFLGAFFELAGGVYMSNVYLEFTKDRMQFANTGITVHGPFDQDSQVSDHGELDALSTFFSRIGLNPTIKELAQTTHGRVKTQTPEGAKGFHWIGIKAIPKVDLAKFKFGVRPRCDWSPLQRMETYTDDNNDLYIGGEFDNRRLRRANVKNGEFLRYALIQVAYSQILWRETRDEQRGMKNSIRMEYNRSKTRVNEIGEGGEEEEDNNLSASDENGQKLKELFDRYDLKNYQIDTASHSLLSQPTLSAASGSTTEMRALMNARGPAATELGGPLKTSQKTIYGLVLPNFKVTTSSLAFKVSEGGIQTTIGESTLKIMQPDQQFLQAQGMATIATQQILPRLNAAQRNYLGL